jgi:hypothetical protein
MPGSGSASYSFQVGMLVAIKEWQIINQGTKIYKIMKTAKGTCCLDIYQFHSHSWLICTGSSKA